MTATNVSGLRVSVEGDLPKDVVEKISAAVRRAVLDEVAKLDLAPGLRETPLAEGLSGQDSIVFPPILGLWLQPFEQ